MNGMYIRLDAAEKTALARLAERERRDQRDQAAVLIRQGLIACGVMLEDGSVAFDSRYDVRTKQPDPREGA